MENPNLLSPSVLAFVGDAVYGLMVRTALAEVNRPSGELHRLSVKLVNAVAQAEGVAVIVPELTEREWWVFKRGRNFRTSTTPKNATNAQYHTATGLEALFGYLYLSGNNERAQELFDKRNSALRQKMTECEAKLKKAIQSLPNAINYEEKIILLKEAIQALKDNSKKPEEQNQFLKAIIQRIELETIDKGIKNTELRLRIFLKL